MIYQADMRMRGEGLERMRRELETEHGQLTAKGLAAMSKYTEARPWNSAFMAAVGKQGKDYWDEELDKKAMLYLAAIRTRDALADDQTGHRHNDAPIDAPPPGTPPPPAGAERRRPERQRPRAEPPAGPPSRRTTADGHPRMEGNRYTTNRQGVPICNDYNQGRCSVRNARQHQPPRTHQCDICLDTHPSSTHDRVVKQRSDAGPPRGRGRGRGRNGG